MRSDVNLIWLLFW